MKRACSKSDAMRLVSSRRGSVTVVTDNLAKEVSKLLARLNATTPPPVQREDEEGMESLGRQLASIAMENKN